MLLNNDNYFSPEAAKKYWSVSQFKSFNKCEAAGKAEALGVYEREETDSLLIGSYVDAYFSGDDVFDGFAKRNADKMFTKKGELYAKFQAANTMINAVENQPLMLDYLSGDKQVIMSADLWGIPWKIKIDVYNGERIVDLKTVKDFGDIWEDGFGRRSWIEFWGYDIQGAIYQKVVEAVTGEKLPFYIAAVTKERIPDVDVIEIPQNVLDTVLGLVEAKIERFDLIKNEDVEPIRCEKCNFCKATKILTNVHRYETEDAGK